MIRLSDARDRDVILERPATRVVSIVPSQTELLASLGLDDEVVGITRFCVRPEAWKSEKPIVGGTKTLRVDKVRGLQPDLILANLEENTRSAVEQLDEIAPVFVSNVRTLDEADAMINAIAHLTGREADGLSLCSGIRSAFEMLPSFGPVRAAYLIWDDPLMTVGGDTFIHHIMERGGLDNVFATRPRYPEISATELVDASPDVLLLPDEPYPFSEEHVPRFQRLLGDVAVLCVDGAAFSWYGSRLIHTPAALREVRTRLGV